MGPASMEVWISSPVRSRNPVLIKASLDLASRMHSLRLMLVRRSSSIIPILIVLRGSCSICSTSLKTSFASLTSSGPCIFGLTIYMESWIEFFGPALRSMLCFAINTVQIASTKPSPTSSPYSSNTNGVVIRCPTLRARSKDLPLRKVFTPFLSVISRSLFKCRSICWPSFLNFVERSPFIRPNQFR